ncbi:Dynein heavy chain 6, axonemal [Hondaea fermentalgiana]|uniref:Dynein heavy chain 6, axonemal n=1 Tax=Hondaea fermentalgiana TaxID=2315210 RepID=A0A2R5GAF0_9STRA|nr:Dynein heavy chain 6, axonemal [Hondaea fermentalgiana]|eukprot:GBG25533.1 Dynein heavy chain 6, axonemal [Hondaea fermentalgiana]
MPVAIWLGAEPAKASRRGVAAPASRILALGRRGSGWSALGLGCGCDAERLCRDQGLPRPGNAGHKMAVTGFTPSTTRALDDDVKASPRPEDLAAKVAASPKRAGLERRLYAGLGGMRRGVTSRDASLQGQLSPQELDDEEIHRRGEAQSVAMLTSELARQRRYRIHHESFTERMIAQEPQCAALLDEKSFLYLVRKPGGTAYDLTLSKTKGDLGGSGQEFFIVSSNGVTVHYPNGSTDFVSMHQFEREFYLFSQINRIDFFRKYRIWKSFKDWKRNVRARKTNAAKASLTENLFILHPLLRTALLCLRTMCVNTASSRLFIIDSTRTYALEEFTETQHLQRELAREQLERFSDEVRQLVVATCDSALRNFLEESGFARQFSSTASAEEKAAAAAAAAAAADSGRRIRAITFTERAAMRTQCRKLTKYIRLVDFLVIDTFLTLAITSTAELLSLISDKQRSQDAGAVSRAKPSADKPLLEDDATTHAETLALHAKQPSSLTTTQGPRPIFIVRMDASVPIEELEVRLTLQEEGDTLAKSGVAFFPTAEEFRAETESIIFDTLKVVTDPERLLTHPDLALYAQPSMDESGTAGDSLDLEMMIVEGAQFQTMVEDIGECLRKAFDEADTFCKTFVPFAKAFVENEQLYARLSLEHYQNEPLEVFQGMLSKYTAQQSAFEVMPTSSNVGIVCVDSEALKTRFVPSPVRCLRKIRELVPQVLRAKTQQNLSEMRHRNDILSQEAYSVEGFVEQLSFLKELGDNIDAVDASFGFAVKLHALCQDFHVPMEEEDNTSIYMLKETNKALHGSIHTAESAVGANTTRFAKELEEKIPRLHTKVSSLRAVLSNVIIFDPAAPSKEVIDFLEDAEKQYGEIQTQREKFTRFQKTLGVAVSTYDELDEVKQDLTIKLKLWRAFRDWDSLSMSWCRTIFEEVDAAAILLEVEKYLKTALQAERGLPGNLVAPTLRERVSDFKRTMPVVTALRCPALQDRHWDTIHRVLGYEVQGVEGLRLGHLIERRAMDHGEVLEQIAVEAVQEDVLVGMLVKVTNKWKTADFTILQYKDTKDKIIGGVDDVIVDLDDSLVTINTILGSRYVKPIRSQVDEWRNKLVLFQETFEEWLLCQRNWMYLESIFSAPDIQRQLPQESKLFAKIDASFRENMRRTADDPNCIKSCTRPGLRETLQKHNANLEKIQKSLEDYLETKRAAFARFYFLSNDELLEILAQTKDPQAVQPHLRKCFDALVALDFGDQPKSIDIKAMVSPEDERIELGKNLKARGNVEDWLTAVEKDMKLSLHKLMKVGLEDYFERSRIDWVRAHPGQIVATVAQIAWVLGTEATLRNAQAASAAGADATATREPSFVDNHFQEDVQTLDAWYRRNVAELDRLTMLVRSDLTKRERKIIVALVTTDVHARDIVETLRDEQVDSLNNFTWQQQLRYYWQKEDIDDCVVRQSNSVIRYAYEYEGCTSRLVITPLTDRCWMTLTGALQLKLGGSPSGPAGTGKTESSKDLAKALGIQCIVYNCSDQIDYKMMAKLFSGLAQAGCWTCLDEFNRIDIEVLSVVAQQLLTLRQGRLAGFDSIAFEGRQIELQEHHVIITMNPGYAGRTELPDNLKVLFRPVSMMVPDYSLIAEIMLFAEGFSDAKTLSRKMTKMYMLSSEQLSQQCHYDYGLRAVKSVLVMAGGLKRGNPHLSEDVVLIRAMRDSNLPKFLSQDVPLFFGILADLFPGVTVPYQDTGDLREMVESVLASETLQCVDAFVGKIIQLYETMNVRFGITIVGPTGGGKSTAYKTLAEALTRLYAQQHAAGIADDDIPYRTVHQQVLNPKCITMGELYGEFNELTQEWTDGLASSIMRGQVASETDDSKWIVFDGPIDALWIENMNTVLDDNMTLCLANGERIKLKAVMKCVFEVQDLEVASPATVSRLGVLYMTPDDLGWLPYVQTWATRDMRVRFGVYADAITSRLLDCVSGVFAEGLEYVQRHCSEPISTCGVQAAASFCKIFEALWGSSPVLSSLGADSSSLASGQQQEKKESKDKQPAQEKQAITEERILRLLDKIFAFAVTWSLGGPIKAADREGFDEWSRTAFERAALSMMGLSAKGQIFDYFVDLREEELRRWDEVVPQFEYSTRVPFSQLVVPTMDTVRFSYVAEKLLAIRRPCFLTGVTGTGKTVLLQSLLRELAQVSNDDNANNMSDAARKAAQEQEVRDSRLGISRVKPVMPILLGFSAQTASKVTQMSIESKLEKKRKTLLGAPAGQSAIICVDDVNMPTVEEYGAQPPIELLRQFLDFGGFYDREKLFFKEIEDTVLTVAAAPPGGGRNVVTPRFVRHFSVLCMPPASEASMMVMFTGILAGYLANGFAPDVRALAPVVVQSTIDVYERMCKEMLPTPSKSHYTFNLRDLSKVVQGILMIQPQRCAGPDTLTRLWVHESMRVFHDRLINSSDKLWFTELALELLRRNFKVQWSAEEVFGSDEATSGSSAAKPPLLFVDFLRGIADENEEEEDESEDDANRVDPRPYEEAQSIAQVAKVLEDALDDYNISFPSKMNLVFFRDAMEHIARIARILRQKRGNAMLVGVGGSGKQSLSRLAMFMSGMKCFQIEITKGYGPTEFREDLKRMMINAGVAGRKVGFLFTDSQIIVDDFLEDVNNILNSGEVPNLFPQDEMDRIVADMGAVVKRLGIPESRDNCKQVFVNRVRDNLHVVLCMSPVGNALRVWCRQFPSLINCCTIDWFLEWPQSALNSVAERFLAKLELPSEECREALVSACAVVHTSIATSAERFLEELNRTVYTTPKSYLDLIELYMSMLHDKRGELTLARDRLSNGIIKLEETNEMVQNLKQELNELMPVLEEKSKDAEVLLKQVAQEQAEASVVKAKVATEENEVNAKATQVAEVQADAQRDLDKAMPALEAAIGALDALDKKDITEIKNFIKPPAAVQTVMEAVNVLLGEKPDWDTAKKVMSDTKFMDNLKGYDKDNIPAATLKKLKKYVEDPMMAVDNVAKVSKAATSLCMWVHAMDVYSVVAKEVGPKRQRLQEMNETLAEANAVLAEKRAALQEVVDKVNALQATCDATLAEKNRLAEEAEQTQARLERAEKLTSGLASEGVRWRETVVVINAQVDELVGDVFLAAACVSYYGAFTGAYRDELVALWQNSVRDLHIPCSGSFNLVDTIGSAVLVREWQLCSLPTDEVSTNNALLATYGKRWPLMIDPQMQANRWIKQKEAKNRLECVKMSDADLLRALEGAVRNGRPLLVEDLGEQIDPGLEPILQKAIFRQNGRTLVRIGDADVDYDANFKFYMTTKLANPHYLPEVCIKVTIINFTVTMDGLEDQLLGLVVRKEKPEIEDRKNRLLMSMAADQKQLKDIESKILRMLSESKGDILDDEELINTLADSKTTSAIISERVAESEKTNAEVNRMRNSYRAVARRGSILYFVVADLAQIDSMYAYSLEYFQKLFSRSIDDSAPSMDPKTRLKNIMTYQNEFVFKNICRGLFETHKLLFAFLITVRIMRFETKRISDLEWTLFLRGPAALVSANPSVAKEPAGGLPDRYPLVAYQTLAVLSEAQPAIFGGLHTYILDHWDSSWAAWAASDCPQDEDLPLDEFCPTFVEDVASDEIEATSSEASDAAPAPRGLSSFHKLLVVKSFREEKTVFSIRHFVHAELGASFVHSPGTSMEDISADMDQKTPCIFVLSQGADPTSILLRFADKCGYTERLHVISLGQGQGAKAETLIANATRTGDWVLLQNCHLAKSWMPTLEEIIAGFNEPAKREATEANLNGEDGEMAATGGGGGAGGGPRRISGDMIHQDFRLFLTSFPAPYFPVSVLQNGLKLTNEPPKGLRANIFRSFDTVLQEDVLDSCPARPEDFRKLLFGLCFFHGVIQERRKFGPLGWNIRYDFDDSDLECSTQGLARFLNEQDEIPWDALRYVTGQINYGGRVTDDWDRRCLLSILGRFYTPGILEDGYTFSRSGRYYAPSDTDMAGYRSYVTGLPDIEDPEVFGMHDNANTTFELKESTTMVGAVISIEPRASGSGSGSTPDEIVEALALKMQESLPEILDVETEAGPRTFVMNEETGLYDPLATFLQQEIAKFNNLLERLSSSMQELVRAIKGFVVMSSDLDKMYTSFLNNAVPALWAQVAYPSLRPLSSWFEDLQTRVAFLREWLRHGEPVVFPLPAFFFPQGFMTGILQTHARKHKVAINSLSFDFSVFRCEEEEIVERPSNGVVVSGLHMEGARWDVASHAIQDSGPGEMYSSMRPIHFLPVEDFKPDPALYACPVYKTSTRAGALSTTGMSTNFVLPIYLPTEADPHFWIWRGVAMLCNLND